MVLANPNISSLLLRQQQANHAVVMCHHKRPELMMSPFVHSSG
jgi:hypothetical protein